MTRPDFVLVIDIFSKFTEYVFFEIQLKEKSRENVPPHVIIAEYVGLGFPKKRGLKKGWVLISISCFENKVSSKEKHNKSLTAFFLKVLKKLTN